MERILEAELTEVVEWTRAEENSSPILDEIGLGEVIAPGTAVVSRTDVARVELAYGARCKMDKEYRYRYQVESLLWQINYPKRQSDH